MARAFPDPVGARLAQLHTMKTTHTPGPWTVTEPTEDGGFCIEGEAGKSAICYGASWFGERNDGPSNARLIAAAPELLDALRDTLAQVKWYAPRNRDELGGQFACDVIAKAEAAIARATHP